jgi:hypothetical protein
MSDLLTPRSPDDIISGRARVTLGGQTYVLPALPWAASDAWEATVNESVAGLLSALDEAGDDTSAIVSALQSQPAALLDALIAYDQSGVLPSREDILAVATKNEVLMAAMEVWRAANPLVDAAVEGLMAGLGSMTRGISSVLSSTQPAPGDGAPRTPASTKPRNGSSPTSTQRRNGRNGTSASRSKRSGSARSSRTTAAPTAVGTSAAAAAAPHLRAVVD